MVLECLLLTKDYQFDSQMSDDNPVVIPEIEPTLCKQIQECNWQVVNVTTPANYFHVLRRQVSIHYAEVYLDASIWLTSVNKSSYSVHDVAICRVEQL